jgi:tRNA dimethylallyltransferase
MQSIGYAQVNEFLDGQIAETDLVERIAAATRQYAKRQVTWFKKLNADIRVSDDANYGEVERIVEAYLRK